MAGPRLLIVDDDGPLLRILSLAFQNEGYRVEVAVDGIDCMNKVSTFGPQVVLMDIMMPKLDGIETIRLLRQGRLHRSIAIVAVSAKVSAAAQKAALDAGADLFVQKPFRIGALIETVTEMLAQTRSS